MFNDEANVLEEIKFFAADLKCDDDDIIRKKLPRSQPKPPSVRVLRSQSKKSKKGSNNECSEPADPITGVHYEEAQKLFDKKKQEIESQLERLDVNNVFSKNKKEVEEMMEQLKYGSSSIKEQREKTLEIMEQITKAFEDR